MIIKTMGSSLLWEILRDLGMLIQWMIHNRKLFLIELVLRLLLSVESYKRLESGEWLVNKRGSYGQWKDLASDDSGIPTSVDVIQIFGSGKCYTGN